MVSRLDPLQVVHGDDQRCVQRQVLDQVDERVHHPELQSGITRHGDRTPAVVSASAGIAAGGEQGGYRPAARVRRGRAAVEGLGDRAERPGAFQLFALTRRDREAAGAGIGERLGQQPGLPDTGLALDEDGCRATDRQRVQRSGEHIQLTHAPPQRRCRCGGDHGRDPTRISSMADVSPPSR